jgi:hypothetical protein
MGRVRELVQNGFVTIVFGDRHPNPHIVAFRPEPIVEQLDKLEKGGFGGVCLYPTRSHLETAIDTTEYEGKPYALSLALGEPQLDYRAFGLMVLETYRNDPRYIYTTDDVSGLISVAGAYNTAGDMADSDQVLLQSFGFAYDNEMRRAVAVFLRYLADLSGEHQRIWQARELEGDFQLHPGLLPVFDPWTVSGEGVCL